MDFVSEMRVVSSAGFLFRVVLDSVCVLFSILFFLAVRVAVRFSLLPMCVSISMCAYGYIAFDVFYTFPVCFSFIHLHYVHGRFLRYVYSASFRCVSEYSCVFSVYMYVCGCLCVRLAFPATKFTLFSCTNTYGPDVDLIGSSEVY